MILITDIKYEEAPNPAKIVKFKGLNAHTSIPNGDSGEIVPEEELIYGEKYQDVHGNFIEIGMTDKVRSALGGLFAHIELLMEQNKYLTYNIEILEKDTSNYKNVLDDYYEQYKSLNRQYEALQHTYNALLHQNKDK